MALVVLGLGFTNAFSAWKECSDRAPSGLRWAAGLYVGLIFLFLYLPIGVLVFFRSTSPGSTRYGQGLRSTGTTSSSPTTLSGLRPATASIVGVASAVISTVIGTMAAFALHRYSFRGKAAFESLLQLPIVIPEIVMGVSLLAFFVLVENAARTFIR